MSWASNSRLVNRRLAAMTSGPNVKSGTNRPSMRRGGLHHHRRYSRTMHVDLLTPHADVRAQRAPQHLLLVLVWSTGQGMRQAALPMRAAVAIPWCRVDDDLVLGCRIPVTPTLDCVGKHSELVVDRARGQRQVGGRLLVRMQLLGPE